MAKKKNDTIKIWYKRIAKLIVLFVLVIEFATVWYNSLNVLKTQSFQGKGNWLIILLYAVIICVFLKIMGGFGIGYEKAANVILSQVIAIFLANGTMGVVVVLVIAELVKMSKILTIIALLCLANVITCIFVTALMSLLYRKIFPPYKMIMVNGQYNNNFSKKIKARSDKYEIVEQVSAVEDIEILKNKFLLYDAVLLNDVPSSLKNKLLKFCFDNSIRVYYTPKISDIMVKGSTEVDLFDTPLFLCENIGISPGKRFVKRILDIVISLLGLIITAPILLIVAIAIKAYDGEKIFFVQERCTIGGKKFKIYKFRSMIVDAEKEGKSIPATDGDSRITPVGRVIRKTRIDELPQLINILKGDMSFVGPRPERVEHVEKYSKEIPEFAYRLKVKGGLTGYAQVYGKYNTSAYDKLKLDLKYIVNYSLLLDIKIILMTLKVIFMKESTEGFE